MKTNLYNAKLHGLALVTAAATFPLIFLGGLVTTKGEGMSVPDWPNTWGYNLFAFPYSRWVGGIFYEHTHRLAAATVGFLTIAIVVLAWTSDQRKSIRWTAVGLLVAVCVQGAIGGLRVVLSARDLAMVHGCAAQLFFCFIATFCVMTSRFWTEHRPPLGRQERAARIVYRISIATVAVIFAQLVVGAIMRHSGAGLAIPDFPTSYGKLLPPTTIDNAFRQAAIHQYGDDLGLNRVTAFQIWIHFAHRVGAALVSGMVIWLGITVLVTLSRCKPVLVPAVFLLALLPVQLTLGILTVLLRKPADIATAHVAVGSLVLMTAWVTVVRTFGVLRGTNSPRMDDMAGRRVEPRTALARID